MSSILPIRFGMLMVAGLFIGIIGWHFDPISLGFEIPSETSLTLFPLSSFAPGLALGLMLAAFHNCKWGELVRRIRIYMRRALSSVEVLLIAAGCIAILYFV